MKSCSFANILEVNGVKVLTSDHYVLTSIDDEFFKFQDRFDDSLLLVKKCKYVDKVTGNIIFFERPSLTPSNMVVNYSKSTTERILSGVAELSNLSFPIRYNSEAAI